MKFKTQLIVVKVFLLVLLGGISAVMYHATTVLIENNGWVTHTSIVIGNANALGKAMVDMETGQRGFMLTGNETFLEPFIAGKRSFTRTVEQTMNLVSDNSPQVERLQAIQQLKKQWLKSAGEYEIDLKRQVDLGKLPQEAIAHVLQGKTIDGMPQPEGHQTGKDIIDEIRKKLEEFIKVEKTLMQERTKASEATGEQAKDIAMFGAVLALFLGGGVTIVMRRTLMGQLGADPSSLIAMSQRVADGMLSTRVEVEEAAASKTNVASTLNHMAETLQKNIETLQEQTEALKGNQNELMDYQHQIEGINASQCVIQFQPDGTILWANGLFLEAMGYSAEEVCNHHHRLFVAEAERTAASYQAFWQDLAAGEEKRGEFSRLRKDGQVVWLQATYTPIRDPHGRVFKIVKYASNITEQKLRHADFQGQIEGINASQCVIQFRPDGTILWANALFLEAMGYSAEEVCNHHHRLFVAEAERTAASYQAFWQDLAAGEEKRGEFSRLRKDGQVVWLQATYTPIRDPHGRVVKIVKYASNITEQKLRHADFQGQIEGINASQCVIQFRPDGTILWANALFLEAMGYSAEEVCNHHHRLFVAEAERTAASYQAFWQDLAAGEEKRGEFSRLRKDGQVVWLQATYTPIRDPHGRVVKIVKYASNITEQKLRHADFQGQIEGINASQCVIQFRPDGTILWANALFLEAMGYSAEEVCNHHHRLFVAEAERTSASYQAFWQDLAAGEEKRGEFSRLRKDGQVVWLQATYTPIRDPHGRVVKIVKYASNITEQKVLNDSYQHQIATLSRGEYLGEFVPKSDQDTVGLALFDLTKTLGQVTAAAEAIAQGDFSTRVEVKGPQDVLGNSINQMNQNLFATQQNMRRESWLKEGQTRLGNATRGDLRLEELTDHALSTLAPYMDAQVGVFYVREKGSEELQLCSTYAFDRRKRLDSTIVLGQGIVGQAAKEKKSFILEEVSEDHISIDTGLGSSPPRNLMVVPIVYQGSVNSVLELASLNPFSDNHKELLDRISENLAIVINSAQNRERLAQTLQKAQDQSEALQHQQEEMQAQNEELQEQTDALKRSEERLQAQSEELKASNEELKEKGDVLAKQKLEIERNSQRVERAKKDVEEKARELERASQYKSEFLANMSHELRTPLNSLLILADSLSKNKTGNLTSEQIEKAQVIHSGGKDLLSLINDILDLSKVEAGKLDVQMETLAISDILDQLRRQFTPLAEKKGLALPVEIEAGAPDSIRTDGQRIQQILRNLLSNALKFTERGAVSIRVHRPEPTVRFSRTELAQDTTVVFSITDTGIGIPADKQQSIFEAFQQADGSTSRRFGGTGLGLSISRELATLLGGEISLQSQEGQGSTFTLYLPITGCAAACDDEGGPNQGSWTHRKPVFHQPSMGTLTQDAGDKSDLEFIPDDRRTLGEHDRSVLIIEDDAVFAKILMDLSHEQGFACLAAEDGRMGLHMARRYRPSAIMLDIGLPHIDGLTVLDTLKRDLNTRHIPVHVVSAYDTQTAVLQNGALGYLQKPPGPEALEQMFQKFESVLQNRIKELLIVEDSPHGRDAMNALLAREDTQMTFATCGQEAYQQLTERTFDCMVLDLGLPDMTGFELLEQLRNDSSITLPPVVVYTGQELTKDEYEQLSWYAKSVVIKGVSSQDRLLDETSLFLHSVESTLPENQRHIIQRLYEPREGLQGRKILVVDDDMRNTFALSSSLQECGCTVLMAADGQLALDVLDREPGIDIIFMDVMMPVMDGIETIGRIRGRTDYGHVPIIALTALMTPDDKDKALSAGANDFLTKPIEMDQLIALMNLWLQPCPTPQ